MLITYFYPFERPDLEVFMDEEFAFQRKKDNVVIHIVNGSKDKNESLLFLSKSDRLYIVAHGNNSIVAASRSGKDVLTPLQLAYLLVGKKLPKNFIDLRIISCDSGVNIGVVPAFAQRFKECMFALGYHQLMVTGYLGKTILRRSYRIMNTEEAIFLQHPKKGIKPHENYINLIKSPFGIDEVFYYAASGFKKIF